MTQTDSAILGATETQTFSLQGLRQNAEESDKGEVIEAKDDFEEILDEWKSAKDFILSKFIFRMLIATWAAFSIVSDCLLVEEYIEAGLELEVNHTLTNESNPFNSSHTTSTEPRLNPLTKGTLTLLIQFLPGIQWYTSISTKHKLYRFLTSVCFPFFTVIFKVPYHFEVNCPLSHIFDLQIGGAFHQGPKTAETVQKLSTFEAISDSMIQLILQVSALC